MSVKITIYDIARKAGVSAKTVSKVINSKDGVSEETRKKVLEIVKEVGYHPNIFARSLRKNKPACIGVTFPAPIEIIPFSPNFFLWLFMELYRIFGKRGEYICFDMFPYEVGKPGNYARGVLDYLFKACVLAGPISLSDTVVKNIHESGIPYVAFGRLDSFPELSYATVDYEKAAYISTKFLIDRGHKHIALLQAFHEYQPGLERVRGYKKALEEAGLTFSDVNIKHVNFGAKNVAMRVHQLLADVNIKHVNFGAKNVAMRVHQLLADMKVTALIDSSGTENGDAIKEGFRRAGRKIGEDCEVVTWTYEEKGCVIRESSAHVWLPVRESASEGMEQLAKWIEGEREGPIKVLFNPILDLDRAQDKELEPSYRFFETYMEQ